MGSSAALCWRRTGTRTRKVLLTLTREGNRGEVQFDGMTYPARFRFAGIKRRWDFGLDLGRLTHLYAITIRPDGIGHYFDFSTADTGESSQTFMCQPAR